MPPQRTIASFYQGGLAAALQQRPQAPPAPHAAARDVAVGGVDVVMPQRPLPARAEEEEEERCGGSGAFGDAFGSASAVCEGGGAAAEERGSPPPLRVFTRKRRAPAADGAPPAPAIAVATSAASPPDATAPATASAASAPPRRPPPKFKQLYLDLGQADFGHATCAGCGMLYVRGEAGEERLHAAFHAAAAAASRGVAFRGWRHERVTWRGEDGTRVVHVAPVDPPAHAAKAAAVARHVTTALGLPPGWLLPQEQQGDTSAVASSKSASMMTSSAAAAAASGRVHAFLLVAPTGRVDGALFAEAIASAHRVLPCCADAAAAAANAGTASQIVRHERAAVPAAAGVRAIWVAPSARRRGAGSALLDSLRARLHHGVVLRRDQLAFSQPTQEGRALAASYCGTDAFLVYSDAIEQ